MDIELNIWIATLVFGISLPLAVMSGAALLGLRDVPSKAAGLLRLLMCVGALLTLLLLFGAQYYVAIVSAFSLVTTLHLLSYWGLRWSVRSNSNR